MTKVGSTGTCPHMAAQARTAAPKDAGGPSPAKVGRTAASTVLDVGARMGANEKVLQSAVATVIQESVARNMQGGDRDSRGLFQQRPSQSWGTAEQVRDPEHAAREYFERAIASDRKDSDQSLAELAQSVQISAFPDAYAQWGGEAKEIVAAWRG